MKSLIAFFKALLPRFKPMIIRTVQAEMDKRQGEDINAILKVLDKYPHGLNGEQIEELVNKLHDVAEQMIIYQIERI
jgi:predicted KAP-like P-loop ATPase